MKTTKIKNKQKPGSSSTAITTRQTQVPGDEQMTAIERFVLDPRVDVEKLERVIALQERARSEGSRIAFFGAISKLQFSLPRIGKQGTIYMKGGTKVRNKYAKMGDDILPIVKPILAECGFSIRWRTAFFVDDGKRMIRVIGILSHELGWSEESVFEAPPDTHDSRNYVQSLGSTISYGHRYTMVDLLNLEMADDVSDDDGQSATSATSSPDRKQLHERQIAADNGVVNAKQLKRLYTIAEKSKRTKEEIKAWLAVEFNITSSKEIIQGDYNHIIDSIERPGPLGGSIQEREPGEEG